MEEQPFMQVPLRGCRAPVPRPNLSLNLRAGKRPLTGGATRVASPLGWSVALKTRSNRLVSWEGDS